MSDAASHTPVETVRNELATLAAQIDDLDKARAALEKRKQDAETKLGHLIGILPRHVDAELRERFAFVYKQSHGYRLDLSLCETHPEEQTEEEEAVAAYEMCEAHPPHRHQYSLELRFRFVHPNYALSMRREASCTLTTKCEAVKRVLYEIIEAWGFSPTWPLHWTGNID